VVDPPRPLTADQPPYPGGDKAMTERRYFLQATTTRTIMPEVKREAPEALTASSETKPQKPGLDY
jgi:hypothetical protein